jgi:hypothetical protein
VYSADQASGFLGVEEWLKSHRTSPDARYRGFWKRDNGRGMVLEQGVSSTQQQASL